MKTAFNTPIRRILLSLAIGLLAAWLLSEGAFLLLKDSSDHVPQEIPLVIPAGTSEQIAAGLTPLAIPQNLTFVEGDTLVVINNDSVSHQLGPVWVPPGNSASLLIDQANQYSYACSFSASRYLGLDVRPRVTLRTRLIAIAFAGPPMGVLIALYGFVVFPLPQRKPTEIVTLTGSSGS